MCATASTGGPVRPSPPEAWRLRALAAVLSLGCGDLAAQPAGMQARVGAATLSQQGATLVVATRNGGAGYSALDWQRFSIPTGTAVRFDQPSAASVSINRVTGGAPSSLMGALSSNGRLVLVNPAGIAIGAGAVVDTAGFTASTVNASDADLLSGRFASARDLAGPAADLVAEGRILARHGDVVLVGGHLRQSGRIEATSASLEGGRVVLRALGEAQVAGEVVAGSDGVGGAIDVFGQRVVLAAGALLDASGPTGGGQLRVGGDFQGANAEVPNAQATQVAAGARLLADASVRGGGGRVIVWSDGRTESAGAISARGGPQGGDGGFVEVSGHQQLVFSSPVDTRAPMGRVGKLLLDPSDLELVAGPTPTGQSSDVSQLGIDDLLAANADISLQATGSITVSSAMALAQDLHLAITARIALVVNAPLTASGTGTVRLTANGLLVPGDPWIGPSTLQLQAPLTASAITLSASGDTGSGIALQGADLQAGAGLLSLTAPTVTLAGSNRLWGAGGTQITGDVSLASGASWRTSGPVVGGAQAAGVVDITGAFDLAAGASLRMAMGQGVQDQIRMQPGHSANFLGASALVLDLPAGASRPAFGAHTLISGSAGGVLPTVSAGAALAGTRLRWGSLEADVPAPASGALVGFVAGSTSALPPSPERAPASTPFSADGPVAYEGSDEDCP